MVAMKLKIKYFAKHLCFRFLGSPSVQVPTKPNLKKAQYLLKDILFPVSGKPQYVSTPNLKKAHYNIYLRVLMIHKTDNDCTQNNVYIKQSPLPYRSKCMLGCITALSHSVT